MTPHETDPALVTPLPVSPEILQHLAAAPWRDTMHVQYHQYIMQDKDPWLLQEIASLIRQHGYSRRFGQWLYRYVHIDGYKYWTIQDCLNREPLPQEAPHGDTPETGR
jgi:hypothetical protein